MQKLVILGAGESGTGAALLGKAKGYEVFVSDMGKIQEKYADILKSENISFEEGSHDEQRILSAHLVIKSPGISDTAPLVKKLKEKKIEVISEIEFASRFTKAKFIAITGSNGKTTTTLLTYHLLKKLGLNVGLAGNIGDSLARQVINDTFDYFVLELSSFQLDDMYKFRAHIAILLNITPDHLDRYDNNFQNYINSKFRIIQNMKGTDYFICFSDDEVISREMGKRSVLPQIWEISLKEKVGDGAYLKDDKLNIVIDEGDEKEFAIDTINLPLKGKHNMINTMAAVLAATALNLEEERFVEAMKDFKNASHRLEEAGTVNGVRFINDSKATNVDSVLYALDSFNAPLIWIAGGLDKGNDYSQIEDLVKKKVKALVCLGKDNSKLYKAFEGKVTITDTNNAQDAVNRAYEIASPGDIVLLSPACASFDLFRNYEDRGDQFKAAVKNLAEKVKLENN